MGSCCLSPFEQGSLHGRHGPRRPHSTNLVYQREHSGCRSSRKNIAQCIRSQCPALKDGAFQGLPVKGRAASSFCAYWRRQGALGIQFARAYRGGQRQELQLPCPDAGAVPAVCASHLRPSGLAIANSRPGRLIGASPSFFAVSAVHAESRYQILVMPAIRVLRAAGIRTPANGLRVCRR